MKPFTYLLTHKSSGKKYYGVKCSVKSDPSMLWVTYFSSSKIIKELIKQEGKEAFDFEIRQVFQTKDAAMLWEQRFLTKVGAAKSPGWFNKYNGGANWRCNSHTEETKKKISDKMAGRTMSEDHKSKIAAKSTWAGKLTPEQILKRSLKLIGTKHPPEGVARMCKSKIGLKKIKMADGSFKMVRPQSDQ
jgi:hypothetical protein